MNFRYLLPMFLAMNSHKETIIPASRHGNAGYAGYARYAGLAGFAGFAQQSAFFDSLSCFDGVGIEVVMQKRFLDSRVNHPHIFNANRKVDIFKRKVSRISERKTI